MAPNDPLQEGEALLAGSLRIGTCNMSHWSADKASLIAHDIPCDILALQETHLAPLSLEWARTTSNSLGLHLHHGRPAIPMTPSPHGRSCGVGFVATSGIPLTLVLPQGAPWRMLHAMRRLTAVQLPPRVGLPRGLLLVSLYAPLRTQPLDRDRFVLAMLELTHSLDMQVPTLLLGDFNGALLPARDTSAGSHHSLPVCPLLAALLGPGGAWVDVHVALLPPPLPWTFQHPGSGGRQACSRIDLILANRAAMSLMLSATVYPEVRSGGHCPVLVTLRLAGPISIPWQRPRPRLPALLQLSSAELHNFPDWTSLVQKWSTSVPGLTALSPSIPHTLDSLSQALRTALHHLVHLAGGWQERPPTRRPAYDSDRTRCLRRQLKLLHHLQALMHRPSADPLFPGGWPHRWILLLEELGSLGVDLPRTTVPTLSLAVATEVQQRQQTLNKELRAMRAVRHRRWEATLPQRWKERPRDIFHWLHAPALPWGATPILDSSGQQCLTPVAVDTAVRGYWLSVLRHHAHVDEDACWTAFSTSRFGPYVPQAQWPFPPWTSDRVRDVLHHMREGASPGSLGVPIAVWRSLPDPWMHAVARLLTMVEAGGRWPAEWLEAYVTMIPKAAGGSRPRDQRPITVLEVLYRVWAKGVVLSWGPTLQTKFLGQAAMGFRAQSGAVYLVQLLSDLIALQRRRHAPLWLASFDIEKCYDMLPWWALFRTLLQAGVSPQLVAVFQSFYVGLQRRFRYGQVDGEVWQAANGLAQGCPASPDLLNILFEAFHRWAQAAGYGVEVAGCRVPSVSFADDLALVGSSKEEMSLLVSAYLEWCALLDVKVVKVQLWCNLPGIHKLHVAGRTLESSPTFRMVGVVLASCETTATRCHLVPRLEKALHTAQRLRCLPLPAPISALLWRIAVLPQAIYGCEVRDVRPTPLAPLVAAGRALYARRLPLHLNMWRSPAVLFSPSLGDSMLRDPMLEVRERQLRWMHLLTNSPGIVGTVHRAVAWVDGCWLEPTPALRSALKDFGWSVRRNVDCLRTVAWPVVSPEVSYPGPVVLEPVDAFPLPGAAFTDGSLADMGGAAVVVEDSEESRLVTVPCPRSSTHCELVALCLALSLDPIPPQILTDSLTSLRLAQAWGRWSVARTLQCMDRVEIRQLVHMAVQLPQPPLLEKVKAHDVAAVLAGHPKSVGNDLADSLARCAAEETGHHLWTAAVGPFGDPVEILDSGGRPMLDVLSGVRQGHWEKCRQLLFRRRPWMLQLYPTELDIDWGLSSGIFRRPVVNSGCFVYAAPLVVIKWIGRLRAGCLATGQRRHKHLGPSRVPSPGCLCCGAELEDDAHAVAGCPSTGSEDWMANLEEAWHGAASACNLDVPLPPPDWLAAHRLPLLAALIPVPLTRSLPLSTGDGSRFLARLHRSLAQVTAEVLRRRQEILFAGPAPVPDTSLPAASLLRQCPLPPERQLSVPALRSLEVARRASQPLPSSASTDCPVAPLASVPPIVASIAPPNGEPRRAWLQSRLIRLLQEDTVVCDVAVGSVGTCLLELFERVVGEPFTMNPGALVSARVKAIARMLTTLVGRVGLFDPPLLQGKRVFRTGPYSCWNRRPREWVDWEAWRRQVELSETFRVGPRGARETMADVDAGLASWVRGHRYLQPVEVAQGECSMALLILWEVEYGGPFPSASADRAGALAGFTRRLWKRVQADEELQLWLSTKDVQQPLVPGLPDSHHTRWSVRVCKPPTGEPQGWYAEFTTRWLAYVGSLAQPAGRSTVPSGPTALTTPSAMPSAQGAPERSKASRRRPRSGDVEGPPARRRALPTSRPAPQPEEATLTSTPEGGQRRPRSPTTAPPPRPTKRQCDLRSWLQPRPQLAPALATPPPQAVPPMPQPEHGRASPGPPT